MTQNRTPPDTAKEQSAIFAAALQIVAILAALAYVLVNDYPPLALAGVITFLFTAYVCVRLLLWTGNDRFSPKRMRVGITWALIGLDEITDEFDTGPVRMYFSLLLLMFAGLFLRPIAVWILL